MDRYTQLPSGREVGYYLSDLQYTGFKKAKSIVKSLLSGDTLNFNEGFDGLACMNHNSKTIIVNPLMYLAEIDPMYDRIKKQHPDNYWRVWRTTLTWGLIGIVCHEIGHALYTLSPAESMNYIQGSKVPDFFIHFCSNVVEDSYIQNKMKERFKWDLLRDGLNTSTALFQGLTTCEDFEKKTEYTAKDKMFYFILRSYNPNFAQPKGCDIPEELIDEFLTFYYANDSKQRFLSTLAWSEKVYDWLKDELQDEQNQQQQQSGQQGQQGQGSGSGQGGSNSGANGKSQSQQGNQPGSKGVGSGGKLSEDDLKQAIKDLVDQLSKDTGVGSGADQSQGSFDQNAFNNDTISDTVGMCNGIFRLKGNNADPLNDDARKVLTSYNLNFRRLQVYSFNGIAYNQPSGKLYQSKIYKSDISTKIFTRETGRKREMDLYFGITLDSSGSMSGTYYTLVDIIVPLLHSLNGIKAKSEMLVFSDETVKVKDYYDTNLSTLYSDTIKADMSGGTDLVPSLKYFTSVIRERNHKDKCIIVVTDGQTENMQECAELVRNLRKYNTCVVGIGLKLGDDPKWFTSLFGEDTLLYPTEESIKENIAKDLITYLSNRFMRR